MKLSEILHKKRTFYYTQKNKIRKHTRQKISLIPNSQS